MAADPRQTSPSLSLTPLQPYSLCNDKVPSLLSFFSFLLFINNNLHGNLEVLIIRASSGLLGVTLTHCRVDLGNLVTEAPRPS